MPVSSPLDQFLKWEKKIPNKIFLRQPFDGRWKTWTWAEAGLECRKLAASMRSMALPDGSHVAILSKNCAHWIMADIAIMMAGYVSVPVYPSLSAASIQPILEHSDTKIIIVGKLDDYPRQKAGIPKDVNVISVEAYGINEDVTWEKSVSYMNPVKSIYEWKPNDVQTIIYTSGTTGSPKGAIHTVSSMDAVLKVVIVELGLGTRGRLFSYLPLSHIAERLAVEMNGIYNGCTISFAESLESFAKDLAGTQPNCFLAVPRIWAKFREGILKKMPQDKLDRLLRIPIISAIVKRSIKKKLGLASASVILCGAAPIGVDLLSWFEKLGIKILVAYGMTEDCCYNHMERPGEYRLGSVGKALPGLQSKISEEGEIRVKSAGNTVGYYKQPELSAAAFDEEGYLKTGDIGSYDSDGFLFITGRLKDQFKTDKGKYISPGPIEVKLQENADIETVCVVGMGIPQPIALINLSETAKLKSKEAIKKSILDTLAVLNPLLENFERLEKAVIMRENWSIENGLMTPSLKIKRNLVEKDLLTLYPHWYQDAEKVLWE